MDFADTDVEAQLRLELRALMDEHVPPDFLGAFSSDPGDLEIAERFCRTLGAQRLLALSWPIELGGRNATTGELTVLREEMWARHEPRGAQYMGVNWIGPAIMRFGTAEQKNQHLPRIAAGEVIWCQGFSEPDSGSDLASLKTAARPTEDGWSIFGQKVWTSYALMAEWILLLARTDATGRKHKGITVFLIPMDRPGIEVRPIPAMLGPHHLNEVFLTGVPVTQSDVLGEVGEGWAVVREALGFERVGIARYARCERLLHEAAEVLGDRWAHVPATLKQRWAQALVHTRQARLLALKVVERQEAGVIDPVDAAAYRIAVTRLDQETAEVLMDIVGPSVFSSDEKHDLFARAVEDHWRYAQASTVASGSIEMQRILLARTVLGDSR